MLCDADGTLFDSERPAFVASAAVANHLLATLGADGGITPDELRRRFSGRPFRALASELARERRRAVDAETLASWVLEEQRAVTARLVSVLRPDPQVTVPLVSLASRRQLAIVSSSADARLSACLAAAGLGDLFPPSRRFSAEDSLAPPVGKPDPAIYQLAGSRLGIASAAGLAVEDAVAGVQAAVAAGFPVIGNLQFVARAEREERVAALREAGAAAVVASWSDLAELLGCDTGRDATISRAPG